jgi:hypothetical protein
MEYLILGIFGIIFATTFYGLYRFVRMMYSDNHYTYVTSYDEEGREIETVVDWTDQTTYQVKKDR